MQNVLSIDVEEYFHPTETRTSGDMSQWGSLESRVGGQIERILNMLEQCNVSATFFVLGWVAERDPQLVREIASRGHQIGCHSYAHQLVYNLEREKFRQDTITAIRRIEDACGITPRAYRAPSYSITERSVWALEILIECGFTHDSSIYPIKHDRYGMPGSERHAHRIETTAGSILEVPVATVKLFTGRIAPIGGGGYLRLLPYTYTAAGIRRVNETEQQPACIYFHPWELDPEQPRLGNGMISRIRTYTGLRSMAGKIKHLLSDFEFGRMDQIYPENTDAGREPELVTVTLGPKPPKPSVRAKAAAADRF